MACCGVPAAVLPAQLAMQTPVAWRGMQPTMGLPGSPVWIDQAMSPPVAAHAAHCGLTRQQKQFDYESSRPQHRAS
jgi:hypothetical protein